MQTMKYCKVYDEPTMTAPIEVTFAIDYILFTATRALRESWRWLKLSDIFLSTVDIFSNMDWPLIL